MGELQNEDVEEEERSEKLCRAGGGGGGEGGGWDGGQLLKGSSNAETQQKPDKTEICLYSFHEDKADAAIKTEANTVIARGRVLVCCSLVKKEKGIFMRGSFKGGGGEEGQGQEVKEGCHRNMLW